VEALTERQLEVTVLVAEGLTNIEIGRDLGIEASSVKSHIEVACKKMRARNRAHLVHLAHRAGYFRRGADGVQSRDTTGSRAL
jgi:DNA-binding NarL/FixJ family response regulator